MVIISSSQGVGDIAVGPVMVRMASILAAYAWCAGIYGYAAFEVADADGTRLISVRLFLLQAPVFAAA
jgi:hypothetical protein